MSTPADYLAFLRQNGVTLWMDDGQLRYQARKGALSAEELARLRGMKDGIVAELSREHGAGTRDSAPLSENGGSQTPLSFQQQWLLKLIREHPDWKATLSYAFRVTGKIDSSALEKALEGALLRHGVLRTRVVSVYGSVRQQVETLQGFRLPVTRISGESEEERQGNALVLLREYAARQLDPAVAPMMLGQLLEVSSQDYFLVLWIHRLGVDCLAVGHVVRDLWALYGEALQGCTVTAMERSGQYGDYARWQQTTDATWQKKHAAYWNERLEGAARIRWPVDACVVSPAIREHGVLASLESSLGEAMSISVRELARQTQTLPALVMLTVYVTSVSMWCKQRDFIMPFLIAGRASEHETVVGCFSHIVYLRVRLAGCENFIELLKQVSNEYYRAAAFRQDFGRNVMRRPELLGGGLCQWLGWPPAQVAGPELDDFTSPLGIQVEKMRFQSLEDLTNVPPALVDMEMSFFETAGDIAALAIYRTDRFAEGTLLRFMKHLRSTVEQVTLAPRARLSG